MIFLASKTLLYPSGIGKKIVPSTLNVIISQMVRNESLRFGGHLYIQVDYNIFWLGALKEAPNLHNPSCFE